MTKALGAVYLLGVLLGAVCSRFLSESLLTYARYFALTDLELHKTGSAALIFSTSFLSRFCQLTLVLLLGFCVLGSGLIPLLLLLKGAGTGIFFSLLYAQLGPLQGMLLQALVFWLPEVLGSLLVVVISVNALHVSWGLLGSCLGKAAAGLGRSARKLVNQYLIGCFVCMIPCGLSVLCSIVFAGLF